jgi:hypothetical protein
MLHSPPLGEDSSFPASVYAACCRAFVDARRDHQDHSRLLCPTTPHRGRLVGRSDRAGATRPVPPADSFGSSQEGLALLPG